MDYNNNNYNNNGWNYQYDYNGIPEPEQKGLARLKRGKDAPALRKLCLTAFICGAALLIYPFMGDIFSALILSSDSVYEMYLESHIFSMFCEILYTIFCVGLPFFIAGIFMRFTGVYNKGLPFGKPYKSKNTALIIVGGLGLCYLGSLISSYIAVFFESAGVEFYSRNEILEGVDTPDSVLALVLMIVHSALMPAFVEEFAFRGILLQPLRAWGDWFAIIVSAVLFGMMHANMTQMPFAIIAGVALGFATVVTGSLWTSICIHFLNNLASVVYAVLLASPYEGYAWIFSSGITYGSIAIGAVAVFLYASKNPSGFNLRAGEHPRLKGRTAFYFLTPTMLIAILLLVLITLKDIII